MFSITVLIEMFLLIINLLIIKSTIISYSLADTAKRTQNKNDCATCNKAENNFERKIYLPEYQNKYSRINELNDTNFNFSKINNNRSVVQVPWNLIEGNEKQLEIDKITKK